MCHDAGLDWAHHGAEPCLTHGQVCIRFPPHAIASCVVGTFVPFLIRLTPLCPPVCWCSEDHAREVLGGVDLNGDGVITYDEFKAMMETAGSTSRHA